MSSTQCNRCQVVIVAVYLVSRQIAILLTIFFTLFDQMSPCFEYLWLHHNLRWYDIDYLLNLLYDIGFYLLGFCNSLRDSLQLGTRLLKALS